MGQSDERIPYGEAQSIVIDCYSEFSPELGAVAGEFFVDGYIDAPPRPRQARRRVLLVHGARARTRT